MLSEDISYQNVESHVIFLDVLHAYSVEEDVVVDFVLDPKMKGSSRDWIGIYEQGWESYELPLAFEWGLGRPRENSSTKRRIIFSKSDLQQGKFDIKYQFIYINKYLEIMGESSFFSFMEPFDRITILDSPSPKICSTAIKQKPISYKNEYDDDQSHPSQMFKNDKIVSRCKFSELNCYDKVCTSCSECQHLCEFLQVQEQVLKKFKGSRDEYEELNKRVENVEFVLSVVYPLFPTRDWDRKQDEIDYVNFVKDILAEIETSEAVGGSELPSDQMLKVSKPDIEDVGFRIGGLSQRELMLKAMIGTQELKIRELTNILFQRKKVLERAEVKENENNEGVVVVVRAEETMVAELCTLNSGSSEESVNKVDCFNCPCIQL